VKTINTPAEAIKLLTKPFDNKRGLHRMNVQQALQIAELIADMNVRHKEARSFLPMLYELSRVWWVKWFTPSLGREVAELDRVLQPAEPVTMGRKL